MENGGKRRRERGRRRGKGGGRLLFLHPAHAT
jgi:hypothetical protein